MSTFLEIITTIGRFAVGLWPIMFVMLLVGIFKRKEGFRTMLRTSIKALIFSWVFLATIRSVFYFLKMDTFLLIPEPINSKLFLLAGLFLLPMVFAIVLEERRRSIVVKSLDQMQALSPSEFERLVAETYRDQGHQVDIVGATGDHGIDLLVRTQKGDSWIVQCKKYRGKVGEPVIRDFYGTLRASQASAGAIVTSGYITDQARLWADGKPIYLYDGPEFLKIIEKNRYRKNLPVEARRTTALIPSEPDPLFKNLLLPAAEAVYAAPAGMVESKNGSFDDALLPDKTPFMEMTNVPDCPACGIPMVEQSKRHLPFMKGRRTFICANAPSCKETYKGD